MIKGKHVAKYDKDQNSTYDLRGKVKPLWLINVFWESCDAQIENILNLLMIELLSV